MIPIMSQTLASYFASFGGEERAVAAGATLFRRNDPIRWLHRVEEGTVHLVRYRRDGGVSVLQRAEAGAFVAEASLFSNAYHCDALIIASGRVTRFAKRDVRDALGTNCAFASAWAQYLSGEIQGIRARAEILAQRTVAARLDSWLALHNDTLPAKGQWSVLAFDIGVSPEALYRLLAGRRAPTKRMA